MSSNKKKKRENKIKKYTNLSIKLILLMLALIIIFQIYVVLSNNYKFNFIINNFGTILTVEMIICILVVMIIEIVSEFYILKQKNINYLPYLYSIDNNAIMYSNLKNEIIEGNLRTEGCIRHKNRYIIKLPKYKCTIKRFDEQELIGYVKVYDKLRYRVGEHSPTSLPNFKFFTIDSIVEYTFEILDKEKYYPFFYETLREKFYDISILDNKIIIRHHFYDNSVNESNHEYYDNYYNYDFTVNTSKDDNDTITSVMEKAEIIYLEIIKQIEESSINGNKN